MNKNATDPMTKSVLSCDPINRMLVVSMWNNGTIYKILNIITIHSICPQLWQQIMMAPIDLKLRYAKILTVFLLLPEGPEKDRQWCMASWLGGKNLLRGYFFANSPQRESTGEAVDKWDKANDSFLKKTAFNKGWQSLQGHNILR